MIPLVITMQLVLQRQRSCRVTTSSTQRACARGSRDSRLVRRVDSTFCVLRDLRSHRAVPALALRTLLDLLLSSRPSLSPGPRRNISHPHLVSSSP